MRFERMRQGRHAPPYFDIIDPNDPEPASGLDAAESQAFGELLAGLVVQWEIGVLLVEHDMTLALWVCDWIHVLDFGRSRIDGPPAFVAASREVREAYLGTLSVGA